MLSLSCITTSPTMGQLSSFMMLRIFPKTHTYVAKMINEAKIIQRAVPFVTLQDKMGAGGLAQNIGDSLIGFYRQFSQKRMLARWKNQGLISPASQIPPTHLSLFVSRYLSMGRSFCQFKEREHA